MCTVKIWGDIVKMLTEVMRNSVTLSLLIFLYKFEIKNGRSLEIAIFNLYIYMAVCTLLQMKLCILMGTRCPRCFGSERGH